MSQLVYGIVRESQRRVIHVVRVQDKILGPYELDDIAERMREKLASRGELTAEVVVVQGASKETLRLSGDPYSVSRVRAALLCGRELDSNQPELKRCAEQLAELLLVCAGFRRHDHRARGQRRANV